MPVDDPTTGGGATRSLIPGFRSLATEHCVTGSMRHVYAFHGRPVTEELLLGAGRGVGFVYWHQRSALPMLGGRANVGRPGEDGLERAAGHATGVAVEVHETTSARRAEAVLLDQIAAGEPVMVQVDMGELDYLAMPPGYHFGGHVVVVAGHDPERGTVLVADRDLPLHEVGLDELERARSSDCRPWPPHRRWWTFDFRHARQPTHAEVYDAIARTAGAVLDPPIANLGVPGIRTAAAAVPKWPSTVGGGDRLRGACINGAIMIEATGGTGGGLFRLMYGRFLTEAADLTGDRRLWEAGHAFTALGGQWEEVAAVLRRAAAAAEPGGDLAAVGPLLLAIADAEEAAWRAVTRDTSEKSGSGKETAPAVTK